MSPFVWILIGIGVAFLFVLLVINLEVGPRTSKAQEKPERSEEHTRMYALELEAGRIKEQQRLAVLTEREQEAEREREMYKARLPVYLETFHCHLPGCPRVCSKPYVDTDPSTDITFYDWDRLGDSYNFDICHVCKLCFCRLHMEYYGSHHVCLEHFIALSNG